MTTRVFGAVAPDATEVFLTNGTSVEAALAASGGGDTGLIATTNDLSAYNATEVVETRGYATVGDGGEGLYIYDSGSSATVDSGSVFEHPDAGRWLLVPQNNTVSTHQFGCHTLTDSTSRFQALFDYAKGTDLTVKGWGEFDLTGTVYTDAHLDMSEATLNYPLDYASYALVVSPVFSIDIADYTTGVRLRSKVLHLPQVKMSKSGQGWTPGSRGITLISLYHCEVYNSRVENFEFGLRCWGRSSSGFVYNIVRCGLIFNNQYSLHLYGDGSSNGWCNQNEFIGGAIAHSSSEVVTSGQRVAGTRHLYLQGVAGALYVGPNNNTFSNVSVEGIVDEYALYAINAPYNTFVNCRWEDGGAAGKTARFQGSSRFNTILYGYDAGGLEVNYVSTADGDPTNNHVFTHAGTTMSSASADRPTLMLNQTSSNVTPSVATYDAALPQSVFGKTNYRAAMNGFGFVHRSGVVDNDEVQIASGGIKLGDGSVPPTIRFVADAQRTRVTNGDLELFDSNYTQQRLRLGNYYLWVDTTGDLRIKNGAPTTDTDGSVVGAQS